MPLQRSTGPRGWVLASAIGLGAMVVAMAAAVVSRMEWRPGPIIVPWGLALAMAGSVSLVALARSFGRGFGFVAAAGWIIGAGAVLVGRPEGDYLIGADHLGYGFLLGATGVVIVGAGYGRRPG